MEKNKKTVKKKSKIVKKTVKKKTVKKINTDINLWVSIADGTMEIVTIKVEQKMAYVSKFGATKIISKESFNEWISELA